MLQQTFLVIRYDVAAMSELPFNGARQLGSFSIKKQSQNALRARSILWYHTTLGIDPGRNTQDHAGKLRQG